VCVLACVRACVHAHAYAHPHTSLGLGIMFQNY